MSATISFTMTGIDHCSGACTYCSAASSMSYSQPDIYLEKEKMIPFLKHLNKKTYESFKYDWPKVIDLFNNDPIICEERHKAAKENRTPFIHIDLWGGNPLTCFDAFKETVAFLEDYFKNWKLDLSTSDNGLGIWNDEVFDYLVAHHITVQLSHDGIGEWLRLPFDPLYTEPYGKYWNRLLDNGLLCAVNCTLSFYNYSFFNNIDYWNKWLNGRVCSYIKLNHCYNADYDIKTINKEGKWQDSIIPELKGKEIGNWNLHNGTNEWDKHVLDDHIQEFFHLMLLMKDPMMRNRKDLAPFRQYVEDIAGRYALIPDHDTKTGSCRAFQRFKHNIGNPKSHSLTNFVITSTGAYGECNLIDERYSVENPGGVQPEYCKGCKYEFTKECNTCGSKSFPKECEYQYRMMQLEEMMNWINGFKSGIKQWVNTTL